MGNLPNGKGSMLYPNGMAYVGEFDSGLRHGHGIFTIEDNVHLRYEGEFENDRFWGRGKYTNFGNPELDEPEWCYVGDFAHDLHHGHGEMTDNEGKPLLDDNGIPQRGHFRAHEFVERCPIGDGHCPNCNRNNLSGPGFKPTPPNEEAFCKECGVHPDYEPTGFLRCPTAWVPGPYQRRRRRLEELTGGPTIIRLLREEERAANRPPRI